MLNITKKWRILREKVPHFKDKSQKKAFLNIIRFFAVMLLLSIIAKGVTGAVMPHVTLTKISGGELVNMINAEGQVLSSGQLLITIPKDLMVKEVYVSAGQTVTSDQAIALLDMDSIEEQLSRKKQAHDALVLQYAYLQEKQTADKSSVTNASNTLKWAKEDLEDQNKQNERNIARAENALADAQANNQNADNALTALKNTGNETYENLKAAEDTAKDAQQALEDAQNALDDTRSAAEVALKNAQRAVDNAKISLGSTKQALNEQKLEIEYKNNKDIIDAAGIQLDIANISKEIGYLEELKNTDGKLIAGAPGTILDINLTSGYKTDEASAVSVSDPDAPSFVSVDFRQEDTTGLAADATADIFLNKDAVEATVASISEPDDNGDVHIRINMPENRKMAYGQRVSVSIEKSRNSYSMLLPVQAVRSDVQGEFVLALNEKNTVLGMEDTLIRIPIKVLERSGDMAAVSAPLSFDTKIMLFSEKPVSAGDSVRVDGE